MRPLVSIVMSTYQRRHLLERSLVTYENQQFHNEDLELIIIDDHSTDGTRDYVLDWSRKTRISTVVLTASPKPKEWVDCGWILNLGIRASSGKHIFLTHPEVMIGRQSLIMCVEQLEIRKWTYACCRVYYLSPRDQERLDTVDWRDKGNLSVRDIDQFYDEDFGVAPDFTHSATDVVAQPNSRLPQWESYVFGGCSRETWKTLGGMLETKMWGSVDVAFMERRHTLGIINHTCPQESTIVIHQNHDSPSDVPTPRVEKGWKDELQSVDLKNPAKLIYPNCDFLGWND